MGGRNQPHPPPGQPAGDDRLESNITRPMLGDPGQVAHPAGVGAAVDSHDQNHIPAATIAGFALSPLSAAAAAEINTAIAHLRAVLGDQTYELLARKRETMTTAAMVSYVCDEIDQVQAGMTVVSK